MTWKGTSPNGDAESIEANRHWWTCLWLRSSFSVDSTYPIFTLFGRMIINELGFLGVHRFETDPFDLSWPPHRWFYGTIRSQVGMSTYLHHFTIYFGWIYACGVTLIDGIRKGLVDRRTITDFGVIVVASCLLNTILGKPGHDAFCQLIAVFRDGPLDFLGGCKTSEKE